MPIMINAAFPAFLILAHALLPAGAAAAQSIDAARAAQAEGRFLEAAEFGEALDSSEGYALAAEALAIHSYYIAAGDEKEALGCAAIEVAVFPQRLVLEVGPLCADPSSTRLSLAADELDVSQLLATLVDGASVLQRDGQPWVRLEKRTPARV